MPRTTLSVIAIFYVNIALVYADLFGSGSNEINIPFVPIDNPGNADHVRANTGDLGGVAYRYRMGKYEISRAMISAYNSVNAITIVMDDMTNYGGNGVNRPATGVSWYEAARFVNWLNTSKGFPPAYKFTSSDPDARHISWSSAEAGYDPNNPVRNSLARYFIPTHDEWYKAAYYDPNLNSGVDNYWNYPTSTDRSPTYVTQGTAPNTIVHGLDRSVGPADITNAGGLSPYGTMAQGGNVQEWTEAKNANPSAYIVLRGGSWVAGSAGLHVNSVSSSQGQYSYYTRGFRVASTADPLPFEIVSIEIGSAANKITITWNSEPLTQYRLQASNNLNIWTTVADNITASSGTTTAYQHSFLNDLPDFLFYRIVKEN